MIAAGGFLCAYSPDLLSMVCVGIMLLFVLAGAIVGILPVMSYYKGFRKGEKNVRRAIEVNSDAAWSAISENNNLFRQRTLNRFFLGYRDKVCMQQSSGQILSDVEEYINEDILALESWQGVISQVPGTLTGLGVLGTFVGLIMGLGNLGFGSVDLVLSSVKTLLSGIETAFYTSISGVILSIAFNLIYQTAWNMMCRELGIFTELFHKNVIPTVEEQERYRSRKENARVIELLKRLPKTSGYSAANASAGTPGTAASAMNEQILMPQILEGLKNGSFVFYVQPQYDLNTGKIIGGEALVRWQHPTLGMISPAVFLPILESNGYITKLDQYIWEKVCRQIRDWVNEGVRPLPISINVTKTDLLALDVAEFFAEMLAKYRIPPKYLVIELAENAYLQTHGAVFEVETKLRQSGFKVVVDGFTGDFVALDSIGHITADGLKLDLRYVNQNPNGFSIPAILEQARSMNLQVSAEGIENMEQLSQLKRGGCISGQGYYFSRPVSLETYENMIREGQKE